MSGKRDAPITRTNQKNQFQSFDQAEIMTKQKSLQTKFHEAKANETIIYHQKMKYHGIIYQIGQFVELSHYKSKSPYVAKINKILRVKQSKTEQNEQNCDEEIPFLEVEWYMRKSELSDAKIASQYFQCLSNNQLFASGEIFYIYIESIITKCYVLNFQEYWNISQTGNGIYFTRSTFNTKTKLLNPSPSDWKKFCYCQLPYNPDLRYVECESCHEWIHGDCDPEECAKENFVCQNCLSKQRTSKKK